MKSECSKLLAKKQKSQERTNLAAVAAAVEGADSEESASETSDNESDTSYDNCGSF